MERQERVPDQAQNPAPAPEGAANGHNADLEAAAGSPAPTMAEQRDAALANAAPVQRDPGRQPSRER